MYDYLIIKQKYAKKSIETEFDFTSFPMHTLLLIPILYQFI